MANPGYKHEGGGAGIGQASTAPARALIYNAESFPPCVAVNSPHTNLPYQLRLLFLCLCKRFLQRVGLAGPDAHLLSHLGDVRVEGCVLRIQMAGCR